MDPQPEVKLHERMNSVIMSGCDVITAEINRWESRIIFLTFSNHYSSLPYLQHCPETSRGKVGDPQENELN